MRVRRGKAGNMNERTKAIISAAVIIMVNVAAIYGISLDQSVLMNAICAIAELAALLWAIWKNHNFTYAAAQGQLVVDRIKNEQRALRAKKDA